MKIAYAQLNPAVGDLDGNAGKALAAARAAADAGADMIVYPAHVLTGAPLDGLVSSGAFVADAVFHLNVFAQHCPILALVSCMSTVNVEDDDGETAVTTPGIYVVNDGKAELLAVPALQDDDECPVIEVNDETIAIVHEEHFAPELELANISVLIELSADAYGEETASPAAWNKLFRARSLATTCHAFVVDVNLCGAADGMVFAGGSTVVAPNGQLLHASPLDAEDVFGFDSQMKDVVGIDPEVAALDPNEILWTGIVTATRDYVLKNDFTDVVIGLSGGIDSSVVATVAVDALGAEHVHGVLMPGKFSSEGSIADAEKLAENLGIDTTTVAIDAPVEAFHGALAQACGGAVEGLAAENLQARVRATYLMTISNARGWLVLNTGNKSEAAMGFSTLMGDTCGVFAPIGDVYKTDVYDLAKWRMQRGTSIPQECIDKAPSAELYEGGVDADRLPPYESLDELLFDHVEGNMDAGELLYEGYDRALIGEVLPKVKRSEFKRRLEPLAPKVQGRSFTADRAWPVTNNWNDNSFDAFSKE